jgi:D-3-phosphoglycerate dehydrogenase
LESLRGIVEAGVGYDTIDVEAATERGIPVCNTPDYITSEVTDHALSLILSLHRKVCRISRSTRTGTWNWLEATPIKGFSELTVGIIGLGRIGRQVTERLKAFGPKILFFDPYVTVEKINEVGASRTDLEALLKESDIVTIHCLLTNETKHLIGERELRLMKESAVLVNVSRGAIIDQEALYKALKESWIAAAGLDVLEKEPPNPDDPLLKLDNVIVTPHIAWYSEQSTKLLRRLPAEEVVRILRNERPKHIVNPEVLK